jgi:1,4-dihydroxy-2-naphthoyl-CoA synthase
MSQKSSLPQAAKSVSQVLTADKRPERSAHCSGGNQGRREGGSKRFELTEKAHKVASLEMMVIDLEDMGMELARQISTEEERTGLAKCGAVGRGDDNQGPIRLM